MAKPEPVAAPGSGVQGHRSSESFDLVQAIRGAVRSSPWLTIAISVHVLAGAIFSIMQFSHGGDSSDETTGIQARVVDRRVDEQVPEEVLPEVFDRQAIPENVEAELVAVDVAQITESLIDPNEDLHLDRGDPNAVENLPPGSTGGTGIGVGGAGHHGTGMPAPFASRRLGGGGPPGRGGGPTQKTEEAVLQGLRWLARHQEATGEWSARTFGEHCPPGKPCQPETAGEMGVYSDKGDVGLTSLALLCYLGAGFGHDAKQYLVDTVNAQKLAIGKDIVKKGLQWLVDRQNEDGSFTRDGKYYLYNEAVAALALSEAYGLTRNKFWKEPAQKAIDYICKAQKPNPKDPAELWGWRYVPADYLREQQASPGELSDADISVTGWMVMALKSAQVSGLDVPEASVKGALDFTKWSTGRKGFVGYVGPETAGIPVTGDHDNYAYHLGTMSSIGMCIRIFLEHDLKDPFLFEAADVLLNDLPEVGTDEKHPKVDYYYWYYGSLALNQIDGPDAPKRTNKYWGPWNKAMQDTIIDLQDTKKGECTLGGWMLPDRWSFEYGPIYTTAINVLTLEVYYRYENAFGMKETSKAPKAVPVDTKPSATEDGEADQPRR